MIYSVSYNLASGRFKVEKTVVEKEWKHPRYFNDGEEELYICIEAENEDKALEVAFLKFERMLASTKERLCNSFNESHKTDSVWSLDLDEYDEEGDFMENHEEIDITAYANDKTIYDSSDKKKDGCSCHSHDNDTILLRKREVRGLVSDFTAVAAYAIMRANEKDADLANLYRNLMEDFNEKTEAFLSKKGV